MPRNRFPTLAVLFSRLDLKRPGGAHPFFALLLALVACCLLAAPAATAKPAKPHHRKPPKAKPFYWGAWIGDQITGTDAPWDMSPVHFFEGMVGKGLSLVEFSSAWQVCGRSGCEPYEFPREAMDNVRRYGAVPVYSWGAESSPRTSENQPAFQLASIINGTYDGYIAQFASEARDWGHPFFLRPNWEMNGSWFPWSELANGNSPGQYVAAWRHIHDVFNAVGATNVTWVWCPYADTEKRLKKTPLKPLYPGDAYVDWTCLDGFNWGIRRGSPGWLTFNQIFHSTYLEITRKIAPRKPMVIGEVASSDRGGSKAAWIQDMLRTVRTRYRRVRGLIWMDVNERETNWPIEKPRRVRNAFRHGIRNPAYIPNIFGSQAESPIPPPARR